MFQYPHILRGCKVVRKQLQRVVAKPCFLYHVFQVFVNTAKRVNNRAGEVLVDQHLVQHVFIKIGSAVGFKCSSYPESDSSNDRHLKMSEELPGS